MFDWLRRLFTPPVAPPPRPHLEGYTHISRTVVVNGKTLEGEEADRVSEAVSRATGRMSETIDQTMREIDEALKPKPNNEPR